jgi:hypothetical protein
LASDLIPFWYSFSSFGTTYQWLEHSRRKLFLRRSCRSTFDYRASIGIPNRSRRSTRSSAIQKVPLLFAASIAAGVGGRQQRREFIVVLHTITV